MGKSYAELRGVAFDWNAALDALIKDPDSITPNYMTKLRRLAQEWPTCACGNQCDVIPREKRDGAPKDGELLELGQAFYHHIREANWLEAKDVLWHIEKRSEELITEINRNEQQT